MGVERGQGLGIGLGLGLAGGRGQGLGRVEDVPRQPAKHVGRADLQEAPHAQLAPEEEDVLHPVHRGLQVRQDDGADGVGLGREGGGGGVGEHRHGRGAELHALQEVAELLADDAHDRRMEGHAHLEQGGPVALGLELVHQGADLGGVAAHHGLLGGIEVGHGQTRELGELPLENLHRQIHGGHGPGTGRGGGRPGHAAGAHVHHPEGVLGGQHPGQTEGRELAQAVARQGRRAQAQVQEMGRDRVFEGEQGGLLPAGVQEPVGVGVEEQGLEVVVGAGRQTVQGRGHGRVFADQLAAHARMEGALAGADQGQGRGGLVRRGRMHAPARQPGQGGLVQAPGRLFAQPRAPGGPVAAQAHPVVAAVDPGRMERDSGHARPAPGVLGGNVGQVRLVRVGLQVHDHAGPAEAEGVDLHAARPSGGRGPGLGPPQDAEPGLFQAEVRVRGLVVQGRRQHAPAHGPHAPNEAREARGPQGVADLGLEGGQHRAPVVREEGLQGRDLLAVALHGARAVALHQVQGRAGEAGILEGRPQGHGLGLGHGLHDALVVRAGPHAADEGLDRGLAPPGQGFALEDHHGPALAEDEAVAVAVEGTAQALGLEAPAGEPGQGAQGRELQVVPGGEQLLAAAHHGRVDDSGADEQHRVVQGDEAGGAGRAHGIARAAEAEHVADVPGGRAVEPPDEGGVVHGQALGLQLPDDGRALLRGQAQGAPGDPGDLPAIDVVEQRLDRAGSLGGVLGGEHGDALPRNPALQQAGLAHRAAGQKEREPRGLGHGAEVLRRDPQILARAFEMHEGPGPGVGPALGVGAGIEIEVVVPAIRGHRAHAPAAVQGGRHDLVGVPAQGVAHGHAGHGHPLAPARPAGAHQGRVLRAARGRRQARPGNHLGVQFGQGAHRADLPGGRAAHELAPLAAGILRQAFAAGPAALGGHQQRAHGQLLQPGPEGGLVQLPGPLAALQVAQGPAHGRVQGAHAQAHGLAGNAGGPETGGEDLPLVERGQRAALHDLAAGQVGRAHLQGVGPQEHGPGRAQGVMHPAGQDHAHLAEQLGLAPTGLQGGLGQGQGAQASHVAPGLEALQDHEAHPGPRGQEQQLHVRRQVEHLQALGPQRPGEGRLPGGHRDQRRPVFLDPAQLLGPAGILVQDHDVHGVGQAAHDLGQAAEIALQVGVRARPGGQGRQGPGLGHGAGERGRIADPGHGPLDQGQAGARPVLGGPGAEPLQPRRGLLPEPQGLLGEGPQGRGRAFPEALGEPGGEGGVRAEGNQFVRPQGGVLQGHGGAPDLGGQGPGIGRRRFTQTPHGPGIALVEETPLERAVGRNGRAGFVLELAQPLGGRRGEPSGVGEPMGLLQDHGPGPGGQEGGGRLGRGHAAPKDQGRTVRTQDAAGVVQQETGGFGAADPGGLGGLQGQGRGPDGTPEEVERAVHVARGQNHLGARAEAVQGGPHVLVRHSIQPGMIFDPERCPPGLLRRQGAKRLGVEQDGRPAEGGRHGAFPPQVAQNRDGFAALQAPGLRRAGHDEHERPEHVYAGLVAMISTQDSFAWAAVARPPAAKPNMT